MSCCRDNEYGFSCSCRKPNPLTSQQAEDDGYADYKNDLDRDREEEENEA